MVVADLSPAVVRYGARGRFVGDLRSMAEAAGIERREFGTGLGAVSPDLIAGTRGFRFLSARGRLAHAILPAGPRGLTVARVSSTGHAAAFSEAGRTALTIPLAGGSEVRMGRMTRAVRPGEIFAISPSERASRLMPGAAGRYASYTVLSGAWRGTAAEEGRCWHLADAARAGRLRQLLDLAFAAHAGPKPVPARLTALFEAQIAEMFAGLLARFQPGDIQGRSQAGAVDRARQFLIGRFADPLTTAEIAAAAGTSPRHLQRAFATGLGMSPHRMLAGIRLDQMRARLETPSEATTVTGVALDCGLSHLGRCSEAYRVRFGELPSATLERSRRSRA